MKICPPKKTTNKKKKVVKTHLWNIFVFLKHNSRPNLTSHWHPQVKLIGRGLARVSSPVHNCIWRTFLWPQCPRRDYTSEPLHLPKGTPSKQVENQGDLPQHYVHRRLFSFSFFSILWHSHTCNHPQEELAKFGYTSERKVKKFKNHTLFWRLNMAISEEQFLEIWRLLFFTGFFCCQVVKVHPKNKNAGAQHWELTD